MAADTNAGTTAEVNADSTAETIAESTGSTLFERLGGTYGIAGAVDILVDRLWGSPSEVPRARPATCCGGGSRSAWR